MKHYYDLAPKDGRKSFYGKAVVWLKDGKQILRSYETVVAYIDKNGKFHRTWEGWSATTGRHIAAFGGPGKAEWCKLPVEKAPAIW